MLAGIESLILFVIIAIIGMIASALKKKAEQQQNQPARRRDTREAETAPRGKSWEDELRDLLAEASPMPLPQRPPAPPPIIREAPARVVYAPVEPHPLPDEHIEVSLRTPHPDVEHHFQPLPGLTESAQRMHHAGHLREAVAQHMHDVTHHRVGTTSVKRREASSESREVVAMIRNPQTLRAAMLAGIILGPPRALENQP